MEFLNLNGLQYLVRHPRGFNENTAYPTILFFHGAGSRGQDLNNVIDNPFFEMLDAWEDCPFVIVAPLCSENTWFDLWERVRALAQHVSALPFADADRLYLMGASMGGYATWQLAMSLPELFAAIVPICGGGMYWNASRLKTIPVWAFHGECDPVVRVEESIKMVEAVKAKGGNAKLTIYPETGHASWVPTYANRAVFDWLLTHRRGNVTLTTEGDLTGAKQYG